MWQTNAKVLFVTLVSLGFFTLVAHIIPQLESAVPEELSLGSDVTPEALAEAGGLVFNGAGGCTACHGLGQRAPNLRADHAGEGTIGVRCGSRGPGKDCKQYLWESMTEPGSYLVPGFDNIMPDVRRQLPEDQIWATIAYLQSLGGEITVTAADLPAPGAEAAAPAAGALGVTATTDPLAILRENICVTCHQLGGEGAPIGPPFDGIGSRLTRDAIRQGILDPNASAAVGYEHLKGTMPVFFGERLTAAQLEAVVNFLAEHK